MFVVSGGCARPDSQVSEPKRRSIVIIREHELMTYLRTSVEIDQEIQWNGKGYNVLMIVGRRPDGQSLSGGVTAHEPITITQNRKDFPVAKRTLVLPSGLSVLDVLRQREIIYHPTTRVERFSEETDPTRKAIYRIEAAALNHKLSLGSCEETKRLVKEGTDTLFAYRDYEIGNYPRMLHSMSEHQHATSLTNQELQRSFLQNETLREEEDRKRQAEKAKSMEALTSDLAEARQDLLAFD
ncbi:hypothetical protein FPANT_8309 [Fusarium pseudoanthophilum]|uniref:Uncharacterized protein n=1 Tax=Fusarium pseudoanthophilum TaxID=48495 RepID=A0A8H5KYI0_9HYPO|nr:hypothetical protein FPANT_8309 [Fusarium pseudoanthophilum]